MNAGTRVRILKKLAKPSHSLKPLELSYYPAISLAFLNLNCV